jgi:hypothetical protein
MVKTIFIFVMILYFGGCASSVQSKLDGFIGMDIEMAQRQLGFDFKTNQLKDGKTAYTWVYGETVGFLAKGTGGVVSHRCEINLISDKEGKVISNRFHDTSSLDKATCWNYLK